MTTKEQLEAAVAFVFEEAREQARVPLLELEDELARALRDKQAFARRFEAADEDTNRWKALAALLVRKFGTATAGRPDTYQVTTSLGEMFDLTSDAPEMVVEHVSEQGEVRFVLQPAPHPAPQAEASSPPAS